MSKYKFKSKNRKLIPIFIFVSIFILIVMVTVGYSLWSTTVKIRGNITLTPQEPEDPPTPIGLPAGFVVSGNTLSISKEGLNIGDFSASGQTITVTHNGVLLKSGPDYNTNANGLSIKNLTVGTYVVTNNGIASITFEVIKIDGNNSIIRIIPIIEEEEEMETQSIENENTESEEMETQSIENENTESEEIETQPIENESIENESDILN